MLKKRLEEYGLDSDSKERLLRYYNSEGELLEAEPYQIALVGKMSLEEAKNLQNFIREGVRKDSVGKDFLRKWSKVSSQEDLEVSYEEYDRLSKLYPESPIIWEAKGDLLVRMNRYEEAKEAYRYAYSLYVSKGNKPPRYLRDIVEGRTKLVKNGEVHLTAKNGTINGFTNGIVNGHGVVNGTYRRRVDPGKSREMWKLIAPLAIVFILLAAPLVGYTLYKSGQAFVVDGEFNEWKGVPSYYPLRGSNTSLGVESVQFHEQDGSLMFLIKTSRGVFQNTSGIYMFIDSDSNASTGYYVHGVGADYLIEIYGWDNSIRGKELYMFNGSSQEEYSFKPLDSVVAVYEGDGIEGSARIELNGFRAVVMATDYSGNGEIIPVSYGSPLTVVEEFSASTVIPLNQSTDVLKITFSSTPITLREIEFQVYGTAPLSSITRAELRGSGFRTDNYAIEDGKLIFQDVNAEVSNETVFLSIVVDNPEFSSMSLGFKIDRIGSSSPYFINDMTDGAPYIGNVPAEPALDGSFYDWKNLRNDTVDDVSRGGAIVDDPNVDITSYGSHTSDSLLVFLKVRGKMLGGEDVPVSRGPGVRDSDGDTVPDDVDPYPHDFNNDGVPDSESFIIVNGSSMLDVDGDGIPDYPMGPDMWLNTTIPDDFPAPYAGKEVHRYIGPVPHSTPNGMDTIRIYINSDNDTRTGFSLPQYPFGADYMVELTGKDGVVVNASLYSYHGSWRYEGEVKYFTGFHSLELDTSLKGGEILITTSNWKDEGDVTYNNPLDDAVSSRGIEIDAPGAVNVLDNVEVRGLGTDSLVTPDSYSQTRPSLAVDSQGTLWTVFNDSSGHISFANSTDRGVTWNMYRFSSIMGYNPVVISDSRGDIYIFYENHSSGSYFRYLVHNTSSNSWTLYYISSWTWWENVSNITVAHLKSGNDYIYLAFDYHSTYYYLGYLYTDNFGASWDPKLIVNLSNNPGGPDMTISSGSNPKVFISVEYYSSSWIVAVINNTGLGEDGWRVSTTFSPSGSYNSYRHPSISSQGDSIYLAFEAHYVGWFGGDWDIFFASSTDNGNTWSSASAVNNSAYDERFPWIVAGGSVIYLFFHDERANHIVLRNSTDGGSTWGTPVAVDDASSAVGIYRTVYALYQNGNVYIVWVDSRNGNNDIYFDSIQVPELNQGLIGVVMIIGLAVILRRKNQ